MKKLLTRKNILILITIVAITTAFYWVSVRPVLTKQKCFEETLTQMLRKDIQGEETNYSLQSQIYQECLHRFGY